MTECSLILEDVTIAYNRVPAVHHLSARLAPGRLVGLLGPNGAGKSTLLKALAGLLPLETGKITFRGGSLRDNRSCLAYVPQRETIDWDFPVTVRGVVEMGRFAALGLLRPFRSNDDEVVVDALRLVGLEGYADRQISRLSGGQQQRVFLARAWAQNADVYLLDEPFSGLDRDAAARFLSCLRNLRSSGKLILVSHHDLRSVPEIFDDVLLLNGECVAFGPVATAFSEVNVERAYAMDVFTGAEA